MSHAELDTLIQAKKTVCFSTKSPLPSHFTPNPLTTHNPSQYHCPLLVLLPLAPPPWQMSTTTTPPSLWHTPMWMTTSQLTNLTQKTRHQTFLTLPGTSRSRRLLHGIDIHGSMALLRVLQNKQEGRQHPLGSCCLGQSPHKGWLPKTSYLGP